MIKCPNHTKSKGILTRKIIWRLLVFFNNTQHKINTSRNVRILENNFHNEVTRTDLLDDRILGLPQL